MAQKKQRRNALCSCGSGKKFKDCCYPRPHTTPFSRPARVEASPSRIHLSFRNCGFLCIGLGILGTLAGLGLSHFGGIQFAGTGLLLGTASFLFALLGIGLFAKGVSKDRPLPVPQGTRVGRYVADVSEKWRYDGHEFEIKYTSPTPGKKHRPGRSSCLLVRAAVETPSTLLFNRECWFDRLCKRIGIAREHATDDPAFDDAIYVRTPSHDYAERFLADPTRRLAVTSLLELGFTRVELDGTHAYGAWVGFNPTKDDRPALLKETAKQLRFLTVDLPEVDSTSSQRGLNAEQYKYGLLTFAALFAGTIVFGSRYSALRTAEPLFAGILSCLGVIPAFGWLAAYLLGGRSTSHDDWREVMCAGLVTLPLGCIGLVQGVNGLLDFTPLETRAVTIQGKQIIRGNKGSVSYQLTFPDARRPGSLLKFDVYDWEYNAINPGKTRLELVTGRGALGIEWLHSKRVLF